MSAAFVFPGQGSQAVGMGKALAEAFRAGAGGVRRGRRGARRKAHRDHVGRAGRQADADRERAAGADGGVARGDARARSRGRRRSEARRAIRRRPFARRIFGAGGGRRASRITDTAKLLRIRGRAMQQAVPVGTGAMAALLGLELDAAAAVAAEAAQGEVCQAANDNGGGQVVVSGNKAAVERAVEIAKAKGAKRAMMLQVSAPFHCALMQPAADAMAEALGKTNVKPPVGAGGRQRAGEADQRSAGDRAPPGRAGHRHGALARMRGVHGGRRASRHSTRSAPARC